MKIHSLITTIAILILLVTANFLASRHPIRLDLTQDGMYTLSESTRSILSELDDVVTVRVYFSSNLPPALDPIRRDVDDLLEEYKGIAGRKFQVEKIDPASSALEEQKVAMLGIPPLQINVIRRDKQEVAIVYLGMAVLYGDKQQVIPVVQSTRNLEYILDEALLKVSSSALPRLAWWAPETEGAETGTSYAIMQQALSIRYDIEDISKEFPLDLDPSGYSALVLISPRELGEDVIETITSYISNGGGVIALVDRWTSGEGLSLKPIETDILEMFEGFGVTVEDTVVLDKLSARAAFTGGVVTYHIPYAYWPDVRRQGFNQEVPISSELESAVMPWSSPLLIAADAKPPGDEAVVATTSPDATSVPGKNANLDPKVANQLLLDGDNMRIPLIALIDANVNDDSETANLFIAGSSHWASDRFIQMFPQNAALFQNAVDYFAMGNLLIGIRSRQNVNRPIVQMPDAARFWLKYMNVATGPIAVGLIGLVVYLFRRIRRRSAALKYG